MQNRITFLLILISLIGMNCAGFYSYYIHSINENPSFYDGKKVLVTGTVIHVLALPFVDKGFCKIDDGTGAIWVKPANKVMKKGERITIHGVVKKGITFGGKTFGVIIVEDIPD